MTHRQHIIASRRAHALLLALFGGLALFAIGSMLHSQEPDGYVNSGEGTSDGGDNPVVGSLPCAVDPLLDLKFYQGVGNRQAGSLEPVMGLIGPTLDSKIVDADGIPYGAINRSAGWTIFGLSHSGSTVVMRSTLRSGSVTLAQWVPDSFLGGCVTSYGSLGASKQDITSNLVSLPIQTVASSPLLTADVWYVIAPPTLPSGQSLPPVKVHVIIANGVATISYLP